MELPGPRLGPSCKELAASPATAILPHGGVTGKGLSRVQQQRCPACVRALQGGHARVIGSVVCFWQPQKTQVSKTVLFCLKAPACPPSLVLPPFSSRLELQERS